MIEYMIVSATSPAALIKKVNDKVQQGWQLQGGIAVAVIMNQDVGIYDFYQAMTRERPLDNG